MPLPSFAACRQCRTPGRRRPTPPDAASARAAGEGSCASKHALLAEELAAIGRQSLPLLVVGSLVPTMLKTDPELAPGTHLSEVHECLTVLPSRQTAAVGEARPEASEPTAYASRKLSRHAGKGQANR
ncbi:MAG TPA: hypothetical protein VIP09_15205 [Dehalococcoidia bacterium]